MGNSAARMRKQAKRLKGRKVCITLHDGRTYVGWITGLDQGALILSKRRSNHKPRRASTSRSQKATTSAFLPMLGTLLGGSGAGAAGGPGGGLGGGLGGLMGGGLRFFGMIQKAMPVMKMGYSMIKTIRPFMSGLKGLMGGGGGV
ncbi:LSm family protein [Paenibacillus sp. FSL L8-0463]|uniref:LSm family protein n=1 Tax=Paenibacillus sp. FSL L8-0463 TaxID=2954687 RepID=UPI0031194F7A